MSKRKRSQWRGGWLVLASLVGVLGGCPVPSRPPPSEPATDSLQPQGQTNQDEIRRSLSNTPPVANAGRDQAVSAGTRVLLQAAGSHDADGDRLSYEWYQVDGWPTVELVPNRYGSVAEFEAPSDLTAEAALTFRLLVRDGFAYDTDDVQISIRPR